MKRRNTLHRLELLVVVMMTLIDLQQALRERGVTIPVPVVRSIGPA